MGLFGGLRGDTVGADTSSYIFRFEYLVSTDTIWDVQGSAEPAYKALLALARLLSSDPTTLLVVTSLVGSLLYVSAIRRLSPLPAISLFVFIAFGFYVFHMNGLRQGLALGVYMHALPALLRGRALHYGCWVLAATLFHASAAVALPLYFLFRLGFSMWSLGLVLVAAGTMTLSTGLIPQVAGLVSERYALYGQRTETGGSMLAAFNVLVAGIFVIARPLILPLLSKDYSIFLMMMLFGATIFSIVTLTGSYVEMTRGALYFTVSMTFLSGLLLQSIRGAMARGFAVATAVVAGSIFYALYLSQIGGYSPYVLR
jgi:hypothetical protein